MMSTHACYYAGQGVKVVWLHAGANAAACASVMAMEFLPLPARETAKGIRPILAVQSSLEGTSRSI